MKTKSKIEIFTDNDVYMLQQIVNAFIAEKRVIDIQYQSLKYGGDVYDRVLVWYEEE